MTYDEAANAIREGTVKVEVKHGEKVKTWGGWYRNDKVLVDGVEVGTIQVKRRPKSGRIPGRIESLTLTKTSGRCALGTDIAWLLKESMTCPT